MENKKKQVERLMRAFFPMRRMYADHFQKKRLHFSEVCCLNRLREAGGSMRVCSLARALRVAPPTVTQTITKLENSGLVQRENDTQDRRVVHVSLTENGFRTIEHMNGHMYELFRDISEELGAEDTQRLSELLERVQAYLDAQYHHHKEGEHSCSN